MRILEVPPPNICAIISFAIVIATMVPKCISLNEIGRDRKRVVMCFIINKYYKKLLNHRNAVRNLL